MGFSDISSQIKALKKMKEDEDDENHSDQDQAPKKAILWLV
jgi:hypothetical protein